LFPADFRSFYSGAPAIIFALTWGSKPTVKIPKSQSKLKIAKIDWGMGWPKTRKKWTLPIILPKKGYTYVNVKGKSKC
jgi:hypothetical protein